MDKMSKVNISIDARAKLMGAISLGILLGVIIWLWMAFGTQVVLAYAQGLALWCF